MLSCNKVSKGITYNLTEKLKKSDFTKKKYLPGHLGWHWKINRQIQCPDQKVWNFLGRQLKNGSLVTVVYEIRIRFANRK